MGFFLSVFLPVFLMLLALRAIALPIRWGLKLALNSACGFLLLWLLNSLSGFTGLFFPINFFSALIVGFLGLPGIGVLALIQVFL